MDCPTQSNHVAKTRCKISVSQPPGTDLRICASKGLHINLLQGWVFELLRNARKSLRLQPQGLQNYRTGKLEPEFTSQFGHLLFSWMQDLNLAKWWTLGKLESVEGLVSWWWDWAQCPDDLTYDLPSSQLVAPFGSSQIWKRDLRGHRIRQHFIFDIRLSVIGQKAQEWSELLESSGQGT